MAIKNNSKETFLSIMRSGNVTPDQDERGMYCFYYKNQYIVAEVHDDGVMATLYNIGWHTVSRWDAEAMAHLQQRINMCNTVCRAKAMYNIDEDSDEMTVSGMIVCPLTDTIPNVEAYFTAQLDALLELHSLILNDGSEQDSSEESQTQNPCTEEKEEGGE